MTAAELFDLGGKVALVTGASSGLGVRFARGVGGRRRRGGAGGAPRRAARRARSRIEKAGGRALAVAADVRDRGAMARAFDAAEQAFGTVDILINNAGVAHTDRAVELCEAEWRRVLGTNLDAVLFCVAGGGAAHDRGRQGRRDHQHRLDTRVRRRQGRAAYAVSKAGVIQLTKALALELAIRAFASTPSRRAGSSPISTAISRERAGRRDQARIPLGRFGEARDLDGALLLLASDAGRFMTGTTVVVDGGQVVAVRG